MRMQLLGSLALGVMTAGIAGCGEGQVRSVSDAPVAVSRQGEAGEKPTALPALLKERRALLGQIEECYRVMYDCGMISHVQLYGAGQAAMAADLEMAQTREERVAIRRKMVDAARQFEAQMQLSCKGGYVENAELLKAKASRLEAQIGLEREKGGLSSP